MSRPDGRGKTGFGARAELGSLPRMLMLAGLIASVLLAVAEFLPLLHTHLDSDQNVVGSTTVGSAHSYALLPVAALGVLFSLAVGRLGKGTALLGLGALGVLAMVIALSHDLSAAGEHGIRLYQGRPVPVANTVAYGFYFETFAALLLVLTCVCGFLLIGPPARSTGSGARADSG